MGLFRSSDTTTDHHQRLLSTDENDALPVFVESRRSRCSMLTSWFGSFTIGVLTSCLVFGLLIKQGHLTMRKTYSFPDTDPLPLVPEEKVLFEPDPVFSERANDDTDFAWDMLLPEGRGFVFVPDAESRGLPPGQQTQYGPIYSVSMYHQLHCLARLRKMQWIMIDGIVTGDDGFARAFVEREAISHVQHCYDYLRQAILCAGDMTLEWPKQDGPSSGVAVDGWGITHTCKSKGAIANYMNRFHFNESMSFDAAGR